MNEKNPFTDLVVGKQERPYRMVLYGVDKIGKSTFASGAEKPIYISAENGTAGLDIVRFPERKNMDEINSDIRRLFEQDHDFKTLVIDPIGWIEDLMLKQVCKKQNVDGIEEIGYGKGWVFMREIFIRFLRALDALYMHKKMNIIVIGHSNVVRFNDPEHEAYDRYVINIDQKNSDKLRQWADMILFCNFDTTTKKSGEGLVQKVKAKSFGKRLLYTSRSAAYDAGNRYQLPLRMNLSWPEFWSAYKGEPNKGVTQDQEPEF